MISLSDLPPSSKLELLSFECYLEQPSRYVLRADRRSEHGCLRKVVIPSPNCLVTMVAESGSSVTGDQIVVNLF